MMAVGTMATAAISAGTTIMSADAGQKQARAEQAVAERQALEERSVAQRVAGEEKRKAAFAQSNLVATAGASGSGSSDPTVMQLYQGIEQEGRYNAAVAQAEGDTRAQGIQYEAALKRWKADADARIATIDAAGTLIGGATSAYGQYYKSRMAAKYGRRRGYKTGYG